MNIILLYFVTTYLWCPALCDDTCPNDCRCRTARIPDLGNTYWTSCNKRNVRIIPDLTPLKSVPQPIRLDLKMNRIEVVKKTDFPPGLKVAMLFLSSNEGIEMKDDAFVHMAESLQFLNIERIHLQFVKHFTFLRGLAKLNKLVMSYNEQTSRILPRGLYSDLELSSLKELLLHNCDIAEIKDGAFQGLESLEVLDLTSNKLPEVPMAIRRLPNLRVLKLSFNPIRNIPEASFRGLLKLENLILNDIWGLSLDNGAFQGLENSLQKLSLRKCGFSDIPISKIGELKKLKSLNIEHNPLTSLGKHSFNGSFCLSELDLSDTLFPRDAGIFEAQGDCLRGITLNSLDLTTIPIQILQGLRHIGEVSLKSNKIQVLPRNAFGGIPATSLMLSENPLTEIKPGAFSDLRQHLSIELKETKIPDINFILEYEKNKFREIWFDGTVIPCSCNISRIFDLVEPWTLDGSCFIGDVEYYLRDLETKTELRDNCTSTEDVKYVSFSGDETHQASTNAGITLAVNTIWYVIITLFVLFTGL
ncbi:leucine-rich repeat and immunoglobulin-like domain-containing nogo receptor-interacting protein 3 isoform X2 [Gigantopelta aegis]|uniref:leucine-rich repeat and immunoglobulin-like domain-containing nogo receptor-interacting protein 3 isoform X2 n=1 Tax=Gigantopelta aegis TaxID=1735272 RepID=UPI001B88CAC7|nr:leucine-rich repeat and immunoglobulin-like domain-containing nogo receptor-interacting protein 3 isoform X2 [Gigantopelta aegis]